MFTPGTTGIVADYISREKSYTMATLDVLIGTTYFKVPGISYHVLGMKSREMFFKHHHSDCWMEEVYSPSPKQAFAQPPTSPI